MGTQPAANSAKRPESQSPTSAHASRASKSFWFANEYVEQFESVFAVRLSAVPTIAPALTNSVERQAHLGHGWWHIDDAVTAGLRLYPRDLPALVQRVLYLANPS